MLQLLFVVLMTLFGSVAEAAEVPEEPLVLQTAAPPAGPQLADGWRALTGTGLVLSGLGVGVWGLGAYALTQEFGGLSAIIAAIGGGILIGVGSPLANLSSRAQAYRVGVPRIWSTRGLWTALAAAGCAAVGVILPEPLSIPFFVAAPVLAVTSVVFAAGQGAGNVAHARSAQVAIVPTLAPGRVGLSLAAVW